MDKLWFLLTIDLTDVDVDEADPENEHVRGHHPDKSVEFNHIKTMNKCVFWYRLHKHRVLKANSRSLEENVL